jgi:hypothetical protein
MNTIKAKYLLGSLTAVVLLFAGNTKADLERAIDQAVVQACQKVSDEFNAASFEGIETIAVLPLWGEDKDGYVTDTLKSYLSNSPYKVMVRSTEEWSQLLGEIKWNTLREDIMNPQTVQTFGKIEGCDAIVYGTVRERQASPTMFKAIVRMTLHMADVETGQIVWSSKPVTASVLLEWPEILRAAVYHPVVWVIGGLIILLIVWVAFKKLFRAATRPR